ncbi:aminodeoxychorismate lyase [Endomicrobiia bacterium]|nr:aminodeoxychorismate lyase [Endomicrobiia bacterium]
MIKKMIYILVVVAVCFAILFSIPLFMSNDNVLINVQKGDSVLVVVSRLKENKLIYSKKLFLGLVKITKSENKLKAGAYNFSKKDGILKILKTLKCGSQNVLKFTIPEGSNIKQVAAIIAKTVGIDEAKFIRITTDKNLEGYLMPETYFAIPGMNEEQIIEMMRNEFDKKITPDMYGKAKEMNVEFKDIVIMASIIEKETNKPEEKPIISEVFYNRLKKKMMLQSCATVLYAIEVNKADVTIKDTKFQSPYNTYVHYGLPPGPITNPGIQSIKAALYPANTENLFFVAVGNGSHLFAKSFSGHKKNRQIVKLKQQESKK